MKLTQLALTLAMAGTVYGMENDVTLDMMEKGSSILPELKEAIKYGHGNKIHTLLLAKRAVNSNVADELTEAIGFTKYELQRQNEAMAKAVIDQFWTRYQYIAIPAIQTGLALTSLIYGAIEFGNQANGTVTTAPVSSEAAGSFGVRMVSSAAAFLGFGWQTIQQGRKGWNDSRRKKKVDKLDTSALLLQLMAENAELKGNGGNKANSNNEIIKEEI